MIKDVGRENSRFPEAPDGKCLAIAEKVLLRIWSLSLNFY
jgi:hypothetical protein